MYLCTHFQCPHVFILYSLLWVHTCRTVDVREKDKETDDARISPAETKKVTMTSLSFKWIIFVLQAVTYSFIM